MKTILRSIIFYSFSLYLVSELFSGLKISGGLQTIFLGGLILAGMSLILRPVLQIIAFPINMLTLGLFSFVINAGILYLMTRFVPHINVHSFTIPKIVMSTLKTPKISLNTIESFIFISFVVSFIVTIFGWMTKE